MSRKTPSRELLDRLAAASVPKGVIAKKLVLAPSAVTDMYADRRQLKYDEAIKLLELVPDVPSGIELPLIGLAGAGNWLEAVERTDEHTWAPRQVAEEGDFAVQVVGQSMNLLLPEGSQAIVRPTDRELVGGKLYLLRNAEGEGTIKRYRNDPARFEPVSDDPSFVPFLVGALDFHVIGRIAAGIQTF